MQTETNREQDERAARLAAGAPLREVAGRWLAYEEVDWKKDTYDGTACA